MSYKGIDVSMHNGSVDFNKVKKAGINFVMIRSGYGDILSYPNQKDSKFETNYKNAKAAGLNIGIYHYMYATTAAGAKREAQGFLKTIKDKLPLSMPVALDIEEQAQSKLPVSTVDSIITTFISEVEKAGYYCILYSYESFLKTKVSNTVRSKYDVWCANISNSPSITFGIHQYSFTGKIDGISGNVDLDKTDKNYPSIIKKAGLNGYKKESTKATKTLDTSGYKKGDKNIGVLALKSMLKIAIKKKLVTGSVDDTSGFGGGTEKIVNSLLKKWGYKENGIAGTNFINRLCKELT